ncbi:MAG: hypothetical protein DVB29_05435 [Verrucomicrobia bacterium]|nr:MAG: hypothetical protein DVB29_05435 [Verrucomicrobiota bacterium]
MNKKDRVIVVVGPPRSGTSAITKGLETMGVSLGNTFIPSNIFNEKGFWEDADFHGFNGFILDFYEDRLRRILSIDEEEATHLLQCGYLSVASELLSNKLSENHLLGIKDPRFSLLLPFWRHVFNHCEVDVSFVIALRNPSNVPASHEYYKNQHYEKSLWVWISYLLSCIEYTQGTKRSVVDYDELIKNPKYQMERVAESFMLPLLPKVLRSYSCDFIDPSLRHFYEEQASHLKNSSCYTFAFEIYEKLHAVATDRISFEELEKSLPKWKTQFSFVKSLLLLEEKNNQSIHQLMEINENLQTTNKDQLKTIIDLNKTIMEKFQFVAGLHQNIEQRDQHIAFLMQQQRGS